MGSTWEEKWKNKQDEIPKSIEQVRLHEHQLKQKAKIAEREALLAKLNQEECNITELERELYVLKE